MSPTVTAAIIAASVGVITVIATVVTQYVGRRATSQDTQKAFDEQSKQLDKTLEAQRVQLDRTLAEQRTRTLNERFAAAAGQLGSDKPPEVRLAGVYAMAGLADDWKENRQTCVDVLCGYMRMPYEADPGQDALEPERLAFQASREVRLTVISVITAHLRKEKDDPTSWQGLNFDFRRVIFDGGSFYGAVFSGGRVRFESAMFSHGTVDFTEVTFSSGVAVYFGGAKFCGGTAYFIRTKFSGGTVEFTHAQFSSGTVDFSGAEFCGGTVEFTGAKFSGGTVDLSRAQFSGGLVDFGDVTDWSSPPAFP